MAKANIIKRAGTAIRRSVKAATERIFGGYAGGYGGGGYRNWFDLSQWFGGWYSGSNINFQNELGDPSASSLVMAAVNWVGDRLPEAELQVVETDEEDNDKPIANHPLVSLLRRPNPYYSGATLWKHYSFSWILDGNVYWWLIYDGRGRIVEVWPLPHWCVWPRWFSQTSFIDTYEYQIDGVSMFIPPITDTISDYRNGRILHFRDGIDPANNRVGLSRLKSIYRELYGDGEIANFSAALMKNSGVPPIILTFKEANDVEQGTLEKLRDDAQRRISGDERGKIMAVGWPVEVKQLAFDPESLDLRKLRFINEERVAAVLGIPAQVLGFGIGAEKSSYNNVESAQRDAIYRFLVPLWKYIDQELNLQILPQKQFRSSPNQKVRHDLASVIALQESENEKADRIRQDVVAGILKVKDAQMMRGWPPDEAADYYLRPSSLQAVNSDGTPVYQPVVVVSGATDMPSSGSTAPTPNNPALPSREKKMLTTGVPVMLPTPDEHLDWPLKSAYGVAMFDLFGFPSKAIIDYGLMVPDDDLAEGGREHEPHITLKYGLTGSLEDVQAALRDQPECLITFGVTSYFETPEFDVVYVEVESEGLGSLNAHLVSQVENVETQTGYTPHATVAYVKKGLGSKYAGATFLETYQDRLSVVTYSSPNKLRTSIPLLMDLDRVALNGTTKFLLADNGRPIKTKPDPHIASEESASAWLASVLPPDAQGIESAGSVE